MTRAVMMIIICVDFKHCSYTNHELKPLLDRKFFNYSSSLHSRLVPAYWQLPLGDLGQVDGNCFQLLV